MKILYLCSLKIYETKMSRVRFHSIRELEKRCYVKKWGIYYNDYDEKKTIKENLNNLGITFDFIIIYNPSDYIGLSNLNIPKIIRYNEMHHKNKVLEELNDNKINIVICHLYNDFVYFRDKYTTEYRKFYYISHCIDHSIFKNHEQQKIYDILISGSLYNKIYPLRNKIYNMYKKNKLKKFKVFLQNHPQYKIEDAYTDKYAIEYSKIINQSHIAITCSSIYKYRLAKYTEIPASGTVLGGDIPKSHIEDNFNFIINITNDMNDSEIIETFDYYLSNKKELEKKRIQGLEYVKKYTQEHYVDKFMSILGNYANLKKLTYKSLYPCDDTLLEEIDKVSNSTEFIKYKYNRQRRWNDKINYITKSFPQYIKQENKNYYIVDLGPGFGEFLELMRYCGFKTIGYDADLNSECIMSNAYVQLSALLAKRQKLNIKYIDFFTIYNKIPLPDNSTMIINSQGSFGQLFDKLVIGNINHGRLDKNDANSLWVENENTNNIMYDFLKECYRILIKNGCILICMNKIKNTDYILNVLNTLGIKLGFNITLHKKIPRYIKFVKN